MNIDKHDGWLDIARRCPSANANDRPETSISLLVIHNISLPPGQFGGGYIDDLFTNQLDPQAHDYFADIAHLRVSAHVLIRRDGCIVQYVPFHRCAWHAGVSSYQGRENCNDFSIGIELEGTDKLPYEKLQYEVLAKLVAKLQKTYPSLDKERIVGHCDIAPDRKTDPGHAFRWPYFYHLLATYSNR